jgi:hypothetical protein
MNRIRRDWIELLTQRSVVATLLITSILLLALVFWIASLEFQISDLRLEQRKLRITIDKIERAHIQFNGIE